MLFYDSLLDVRAPKSIHVYAPMNNRPRGTIQLNLVGFNNFDLSMGYNRHNLRIKNREQHQGAFVWASAAQCVSSNASI